MPAATYNLDIEQGASFEKSFFWNDENDDPYDLTGYVARMQVRQTKESGTVLAELTTENDKIEIEPLEGKITLILDDEATEAFAWTEGVYDLELESPAGKVTRLLKGSVTVDLEVTR